MKVMAPGKLILSGEHAVVYGYPALAMAVNRYVTASVTRESSSQILFDLSDLALHRRLSLTGLRSVKERIKRKYHRFIKGDFSIRDVLQKPFELAQFALSVFAESFNLTLPHGVKIQIQSTIPMGCGMGSSAATILSVIKAVSDYLHMPLTQEALFQLALEAENAQHGRSSGLDLRVALQGGCLYMHQHLIEPRCLPTLPMYLVNTGAPVTTTGQCVAKVAPLFQSGRLGDEFAAVTRTIDAALQQQQWAPFQAGIRDNHQLLVQIGVVPAPVDDFIRRIEMANGAAKICGAGAIDGHHAGAVLAFVEAPETLSALCAAFGYTMLPIAGELQGVHVV